MPLYFWVCCLSWGVVDLRRRNTAHLPVGSVVAPHRQENAKVGECTTFKFFMIYMEVPIEIVFSVYIQDDPPIVIKF